MFLSSHKFRLAKFGAYVHDYWTSVFLHSRRFFREKIYLKDLGEGLLTVQIAQVFVEPGYFIKEFDSICEVQSDKVTAKISSPYTGTVFQIYVKPGHHVKVGSMLMEIDTKGFDSSDSCFETSKISKRQLFSLDGETEKSSLIPFDYCTMRKEDFPPISEVIKNVHRNDKHGNSSHFTPSNYWQEGIIGVKSLDICTTKVRATPAARFLCHTHGVSLNSIKSLRNQSYINSNDVKCYIKFVYDQNDESQYPHGKVTSSSSSMNKSIPIASIKAPSETIQRETVHLLDESVIRSSLKNHTKNVFLVSPGDRHQKIEGVQRVMSDTVEKSTVVPIFTACEEIDLGAIILAREKWNNFVSLNKCVSFPHLTFTPFFIKAISLALSKYPIINAFLINNVNNPSILLKGVQNIGIAMDTPYGLIVPNIKSVEKKNILQIADELHHLQKLGHKNSLRFNDVSDTTFTFSNIGTIGAVWTHPLVCPPQVAITAIGQLRKIPRFDSQGNIYPAEIIPLSSSGDHRILDGATLVKFNQEVKKNLELPRTMLDELKEYTILQ